MRRRTKWAAGLLILLLTLPLVGAAWIFVAMSGGVYSIMLNMKSRPDPDSPDLKRNMTKLEEQIRVDFRAIPNERFVHYEASTQDTCYDGANNWKHRDGFAHRCTVRVTNFYGFDGDFRKTMLDIERRLLAAGWRSNIHDMEWTLNHDVAGQDNAAALNHTVDRLPNPYPYYKGGFTLDIRWAERASSRLFDLKNIQAQAMGWVSENTFHDQRKLVDAGDVFRKVTQDHLYIVAIAITGHYFEN